MYTYTYIMWQVMDLFCRLPLPTLFYRPEAANLGDLMRLWVRPGV